MPPPAKALSPETQCLAQTLHHKQCLLQQNLSSKLCHIHQTYPEKLLAKIQAPNFFEGFVPTWRNHERLEIETAIKNNLLEIPKTLLESLPNAIIYGPFYNWYCGFHLNDPWQYPFLGQAAMKDAVRLHTYMLECGHKPSVCREFQGILQAQIANPASVPSFLWNFILMLHRYRRMNRENQEKAIEDLLESEVADPVIWSSFDWSEWLLKNEQDYKEIINNLQEPEEKKKKEIQNFLGLTRLLFQEKVWERKKFLKTKAKSKIYDLKEDLMAKTWHPTRYLEWCFDEDEKAEFINDFGKSIAELQQESTAIWHEPQQLWNRGY
jgi:hypothetical protein